MAAYPGAAPTSESRDATLWWNAGCYSVVVQSISSRVIALALAAAAGPLGCAPIEIQYEPAHMMTEETYIAMSGRPSVAPSHVAVFDRESAPWDYAVVGSLQEVYRGSIPGGPPARKILFREEAGARGCDGVILHGNVSRWDGRYRFVPRWGRSRDASRRAGRWAPLMVLKGEGADCVVRVGPPDRAHLSQASHVSDSEPGGGWSVVPTDYSILRSDHY